MFAFYSDTFVLPLPPDHRFPMRKYSLLREKILAQGILPADTLCIPEAASEVQILRVHTQDYWRRLQVGALTAQEQRRIGFPWSPQMVERTRRSSGGTIAACGAALDQGIAFNLAGGTHHAHNEFGAGFCVTNDSAIAVRAMQAERRVQRVVIIDCDVHQGDGTARIFADDASVFTFSIHGEKNFPFHKARSSLDIELRDQTGDDEYLALVEEGVNRAIAQAGADLAIYLAGADPYAGDRLGRMAISMDGLARRDRIVLEACRTAGLPVAVTMAGGYARDVDDIATIHAQTVRIAASMF
ncbi:MAG: histone deacetylase [Anaerolineae bacterium]|nr:histone deacetylase [Anaerolineae bacterium]